MTAKELIESALAFFVSASGEGLTIDGVCPEEVLCDFFSERDYLPEEWEDYGQAFCDHVIVLAVTEDQSRQLS